jgi:hypothetical protein
MARGLLDDALLEAAVSQPLETESPGIPSRAQYDRLATRSDADYADVIRRALLEGGLLANARPSDHVIDRRGESEWNNIRRRFNWTFRGIPTPEGE